MKISLTAPLLMALLLMGCGTVQHAYIPDETGPIGTPETEAGLSVALSPDSSQVEPGTPIDFTITLRNVSDRQITLPRDPSVRLIWVYPNGQRDNFLVETTEERHYQPRELMTLKPGQALILHRTVKTYYFPFRGITEFHAQLLVPRNTNPRISGVWTGQLKSNRFGVLVDHRKALSRSSSLQQLNPSI